ncbi:MAG: transposase [Alphaproteobacteria bacterium]|nr:transposase [Alphaproteobacteria bacterium]
MERNLYQPLYEAVMAVSYPDPATGVSHSDRWVALAFLWSALHDRPRGWACDPRNWPPDLRPCRLPSESTLSRRLRTAAVGRLLNALLARCRGDPRHDWVKYLDGKPLPVGDFSKDPDARWGRGPDSFSKGYKLHAVWGSAAAPLAWEVRPANAGEPTTARLLVNRLGGEGYLVGDRGYDSNPLAGTAGRRRHQLVAPAKKGGGAGRGHHPQSPFRLRGLELLTHPFGQALYRRRAFVERCFGNLTSFGGGLGPLPSWVRRTHRVKRWVQAKLLINGARALSRQGLAA